MTRSEAVAVRPSLAPLVCATMASQALLVILAPTIVAIGDDLGASVGTVGQARSITAAAAVAVAAALALNVRVERIGVPRLLAVGAGLGIGACGAVAVAPTVQVFLAAHVLVGLAFACLLSAGFAGVAAFPKERRPRAMGRVAGANALAWIVVTPAAGALTDTLSWRVAEAVPAAIALLALLTARTATGALAGPELIRPAALLSATPARRWIGAEMVAYGAWAALLTFVGAYFLERFGVGESTAGALLAAGAAAYVLASTHSDAVTARIPNRLVVAGSATLMAVLAVLLFHPRASLAPAALVYCLMGLVAGVRTPASSGLGLEQLPEHPAAMMVARTAATQLGYLLGAVVGGAVIAAAGYGAFGFVLAAGLAGSALLVLRVRGPSSGPDTRAKSW